MRKEYRDAIISGIGGAILVTILLYIIQGKVAGGYLFTFPIFTFIFHIHFHKKREVKSKRAKVTQECVVLDGILSQVEEIVTLFYPYGVYPPRSR